MNKTNNISKVITGGNGINDLDIKNKLQTKDLVVSGTLTLPPNSLTIPEVSNVQDSLNNITPLINANNDATTNISYGNGYTNIPNVYISNDLLLYDYSSSSNIDVCSYLKFSFIKNIRHNC